MSPVPASNKDITKDGEDTEISASEAPQFNIENSDTDSEGQDEEDGYQGYQLLPQGPEGDNDEIEEAAANDNVSDFAAVETPSVAPIEASLASVDQAIMQSLDRQDMYNFAAPQSQTQQNIASASEQAEVWNSPPAASEVSIPMDEEHMEKIRSAMAGFSLPASAQPSWAGQLSDDDWKHFIQLQRTTTAKPTGKSSKSLKGSTDKTVDR